MSSMTYESVFEAFLGKISDFDFVNIDEEDAYELMTEYLHSTLATAYVRRLFSALTLDDDEQTITYTMDYSVDDDADAGFVQGILVKGMVVEWLKPQVRSKINVQQMFGTKEQKFFAQASHLSAIRGLLEDTELELRKEIRDRGYINNSYLDES